jgi:hypothetical protein
LPNFFCMASINCPLFIYFSFCWEVLLDELCKLIALCFRASGQTFFAKNLIFSEI